MNNHTITKNPTTRLAVIAAAVLLLAGCAAPAPEAALQADTISMSDAWVKSAEEGMSAAFGILTNDGDADVTIVSASTDASPMMELHETVASESGEMMMQEKDGGFVIPAGSTLTLEPGGNHLMLMGLTAPIMAGDDVTFVLTFADGSTLEFIAPAKDFSGANESYEGDMEMDGMDDMESNG
jgi:copper(I)-binding protein